MAGFSSPNHTETPNDLFDVHLKDMGESELKVVMAIIRLTRGYHKETVKASISKLMNVTGLSKQGVIDGAKEAESHGFIIKIGGEKGEKNQWQLNYSDEVVNQVDKVGQQSRQPKAKSSQPGRQHLKKEFKEIFKENVFFSDPQFLEAWGNFEVHRKEIRKPMTEQSAKNVVRKLSAYSVSVAIAALNKSIENGWTGVFPENIKPANSNGHGHKPAPVQRIPRGV